MCLHAERRESEKQQGEPKETEQSKWQKQNMVEHGRGGEGNRIPGSGAQSWLTAQQGNPSAAKAHKQLPKVR